MAELIPLHYRLKAAQKEQINKWCLPLILTAILAISGIAYAYGIQRQRTAEMLTLQAEFQAKSALLDRARQLRLSRADLASRMEKIQQLMDDKVLLLLLRNISDGFSGADSLEFIEIDARGTSLPADKQVGDGLFAVRINGITTNSTTLAELMTRLTKQTDLPMHVVLETSRREKFLDGQVMRFQILCEKVDNKGT